MNINNLKKELTPWLIVETWHTTHPCDCERFNRSLKSAFDSLDTPITFDDFMEAMMQLVKEHHPGMQAIHREDLEGFAMRAENISNYLRDNSI